VKRDTKYITPIKFLVGFMGSLRSGSQLACSLFRDLEAEYPSLMTEFSPKNDEIPIAVLEELDL
jgi:hypothetical protein